MPSSQHIHSGNSILFIDKYITSKQRDLLGPRPGFGGNLAIASKAEASACSSASASATAAAAAAFNWGSSNCLFDLHLDKRLLGLSYCPPGTNLIKVEQRRHNANRIDANAIHLWQMDFYNIS